jgi:hypothetical protein
MVSEAKGCYLNSRGFQPTVTKKNRIHCPKWAEHCFKKFNHCVAGLILMFDPWVITLVY